MDLASGLVRHVVATTAKVADISRTEHRLRSEWQGVRAIAAATTLIEPRMRRHPGRGDALSRRSKDHPWATERARSSTQPDSSGLTSQGRAPDPGYQVTIRIHKSALSGSNKERGAAEHPVCTGQPANGATIIAGIDRIDGCDEREKPQKQVKNSVREY